MQSVRKQQWGGLAPHEPFKAVPMQLEWWVGGGKNPLTQSREQGSKKELLTKKRNAYGKIKNILPHGGTQPFIFACNARKNDVINKNGLLINFDGEIGGLINQNLKGFLTITIL